VGKTPVGYAQIRPCQRVEEPINEEPINEGPCTETGPGFRTSVSR